MTRKKEEIMQSATHLFSEKGYFATSVQEIADDCKISKGSLYNVFNSKEELLIQLIEYNQNKVLQKAVNISPESFSSPKEKLIKKIAVQFDGIRDNRAFITMLLRVLPPHDNPRIPWLMKKIRVTMMNWYKDRLMEAYGSLAEPYIWDLVIMFQGALREYANLAIHENKEIDFQVVARFVIERFDTMIRCTSDVEPFLTSQKMEEYEAFEPDQQYESPQEQIQKLLEELRGKVERLSMPRETQQESIAAVQSLQEEINKNEPRKFLIKALLLYLTDIKECHPLIDRIETVLQATYY
ncbi:TetR/AcrR family transcriptional regulator [Lentibacillus salicampi]|uniref:TetR/AcrR family transcriptional regulator n=1 Tax=Lentibacillus salicampi TaxID=175306 RepID=A0A4Y9AAW1_9BACI|nr:TetR/AcrR family transcriptional regulator [Lentibacillus salicampi]TFJ91504.1 TetR/AcrR family transcriptional regulator [Lentibacillus salicampi]